MQIEIMKLDKGTIRVGEAGEALRKGDGEANRTRGMNMEGARQGEQLSG